MALLGMCKVYYRAKRDKKEATCLQKCPFQVKNGAFLHDMGEKSTLVDFFSIECRKVEYRPSFSTGDFTVL